MPNAIGWRQPALRAALAAVIGLAVAEPQAARARDGAILLAQAGSTGGEIGKRGKSAAGEDTPRRAAPPRERRPAKRAARPPRERSPTPAVEARGGCGRAVGSWLWFNTATVVIHPGGTFSVGILQGTWTCEGTVLVMKGPMWVDRLTLSSDGSRLSGANHLGLAVSGSRL